MSKSFEYWNNLSKKIKSPTETKNKRPDTSDLEVDFLLKFLRKTDDILDVGSGTGLIINKLADKVESITAVEKFEGFTKFISNASNILVINADIIGFKIRKQFDTVLLLGVAQYFSAVDVVEIYRNLFEMTKPGGYLIIRNHCGLEVSKTVNGFSEELGTEYFAEYRHVELEKRLIQGVGFSEIEVFDILPDTINVWKDTKHFFFVCKK